LLSSALCSLSFLLRFIGQVTTVIILDVLFSPPPPGVERRTDGVITDPAGHQSTFFLFVALRIQELKVCSVLEVIGID
jgi:hypothetical protein